MHTFYHLDDTFYNFHNITAHLILPKRICQNQCKEALDYIKYISNTCLRKCRFRVNQTAINQLHF